MIASLSVEMSIPFQEGAKVAKLTQIQRYFHKDRVWSVTWDTNRPTLYSCSSDKTVSVWEINKSTTSAVLQGQHTKTIRAASVSVDGLVAVASFDSTVSIWFNNSLLTVLEGHDSECKSVSFSHDGKYLATCSRDRTVWVWEVIPNTGFDASISQFDFECAAILQDHQNDVKMVLWHPIEYIFASASCDDTIRVFKESDDGEWCSEAVLLGHTSTVWGLSFTKDGELMASCSEDCTIIVWCNFKQICSVLAHDRAVYSVSWAPDSVHLASCSGDCTIKIWRYHSNSLEGILVISNPHGVFDVNCVSWNPFTNTIASCGDDKSVVIWEFEEACDADE